MKSKLVIKIVLDIIMSILFTVLLDAFATGLAFHETAGLFLFGLFLTHIILNWSWVKNTTKNLFRNNIRQHLQTSQKLKYFLNIALFVCITTIVITGLLISQVLFPSEATKSDWIYDIHKWAAYICLAFLVFHIVIHARYLVSSIFKIITEIKSATVRKTLLRLGAVAAITFVLLSRVILNFSASEKVSLGAYNEKAIAKSQSTTNRTERFVDSTTDYALDGEDTSSPHYYEETPDDSTSSITSDSSKEATMTLTEYLSDQYCSGCHDHCSLLRPKCEKGQQWVTEAKQEYQSLYGDISS